LVSATDPGAPAFTLSSFALFYAGSWQMYGVVSRVVNNRTDINIPRTLVLPDFNGAKITKLANKTEEVCIILKPDALKIISIATFLAKGR
jgi:hypothetical protein